MSDSSVYGIYERTVEKGKAQVGVRVECAHGCDGTRHAGWVDEIHYGAGGNVEFARHLFVVEGGNCDGSCELDLCGGRAKGWFRHP